MYSAQSCTDTGCDTGSVAGSVYVDATEELREELRYANRPSQMISLFATFSNHSSTVFSRSTPPRTRRVIPFTSHPCLSDADLRLKSDGVTMVPAVCSSISRTKFNHGSTTSLNSFDSLQPFAALSPIPPLSPAYDSSLRVKRRQKLQNSAEHVALDSRYKPGANPTPLPYSPSPHLNHNVPLDSLTRQGEDVP